MTHIADRPMAGALPLKPHGFEGLRVVPEEFLVVDLAFAQRKDVRHRQIHLRTPACHPPGLPHGDSVASVDEVADRFQSPRVPGFADPLPLAHDRLPAYERSRLGPALRAPHD